MSKCMCYLRVYHVDFFLVLMLSHLLNDNTSFLFNVQTHGAPRTNMVPINEYGALRMIMASYVGDPKKNGTF